MFRNKLKKAISIFLTVTTCLSMLSISFVTYAKNVAKIGNTEFSSLEEAVEAGDNGDEIVLISDTEINSTLDISKSLSISADGSYTVSRGEKSEGSLFNISGALNIRSGVTIDGKGASAKAPLFYVSGLLSINDGVEIKGNVNSVEGGSAVTVSGGEFSFKGGRISSNTCQGYGNAVYVTDNTGTFRMGGDASFDDDSTVYLPPECYIEVESEITGKGNVTINMPSVSVGECIVSGIGGVSDEQIDRFSLFCEKTEYKTVRTEDNLIAGVPTVNNECVSVDGKTFKSLNEAVNSIADGAKAEISIIADCALTETVNIDGGKNITITSDTEQSVYRGFSNGAMFKTAADSSLTVSSKSKLTISGSNALSDTAAFEVQGSLTVENGAVLTKNKTSANGGAIVLTGGNFNMTGGCMNNNSAEAGGAIYIASGSCSLSAGVIYSNIATKGGSIYFADGSLTLSGNCSIYSTTECPNDIYVAKDKKISVNSWNPVEEKGFTNAVTLTPEVVAPYTILASIQGNVKKSNFLLFSKIPSVEYTLIVQDNNLVLAPANEAYGVALNDSGYTTLAEAVAASGGGQNIIEIINDIVLDSTVVIPSGKNIILYAAPNPYNETDFTSRTITRTPGNTSAMFLVEAGASLAIGAPSGKTIFLDGESVSGAEAGILVSGNLDLSDGCKLINFINNANEAATLGVSYGGAVFVNEHAKLNVYGAAFENCYASFGGAIFNMDGTVYISNGSVTNCSALNGGAVYLITNPTDGSYFASMEILKCDFTANSAIEKESINGSGIGGAIFIENGSVVTMAGGCISGNKATKGAGVAIGNTGLIGQLGDEADFIITDDVVISQTDSIYIGSINFGSITVAGDLKNQTEPITIAIPDTLPQNMKLVHYLMSSNMKDNENSAASACASGRFVLEEAAAKYFVLKQSTGDGSVIVNAIPENSFAGYLTGKHYNGIPQYDSLTDEENDGGDTLKDTKEQKTDTTAKETENAQTETDDVLVAINEISAEEKVYNLISLPSNGSFSAYFEMTYYANLYKDMNRYITAPFIKGTTITLIDNSDTGKPGYYYYEVTGNETQIQPAVKIENSELYTPAYIEIPLGEFYKMGSKTEKYSAMTTDGLTPDANGNIKITDKMTFVVDFANIDTQNTFLNQGSFTMSFNHYFSGAVAGERYDISENFKKVEYYAVSSPVNQITAMANVQTCEVSYNLDVGSHSVALNNGVIIIRMTEGNFRNGSYFEDEFGNQYPAQNKSNTVYIPMPKDSSGKVLDSAGRKYTYKNYFSRDDTPLRVTVSILASNDGTHRTLPEMVDCTSQAITLTPQIEADTAVIVTNTENNEKVYIPSLKDVKGGGVISMNVLATITGEAFPTVSMSLLRKNGDGKFEECEIGELFKSTNTKNSKTVELSTGVISLYFNDDISSCLGNEYRLKFAIGSNYEYVKINENK